MTPDEASRHFAKAASKVKANLVDAEQETLKQAKVQAIKGASGPYSSHFLSLAGHPYSTRRPNSSFNPAQINVQTGLFRASFVPVAPVVTAGGIVSQIVNLAPYSGFLQTGTAHMVPRPLAEAVQTQVQPGRVARLQKAVSNAFYKP